jgi:hypothetical protein
VIIFWVKDGNSFGLEQWSKFLNMEMQPNEVGEGNNCIYVVDLGRNSCNSGQNDVGTQKALKNFVKPC